MSNNKSDQRSQDSDNQNNRLQQRGQGRGHSGQQNNNNNCNKRSYVIPESADKDLGKNVFITGAEAAEKHNKTKLSIISYIQKEFTCSEEIKKVLKNKEEFNFTTIRPTFQGTNYDVTMPDGLEFKLKMEKHISKQSHYNPTRAKLMPSYLLNAQQQSRISWKHNLTGTPSKTNPSNHSKQSKTSP